MKCKKQIRIPKMLLQHRRCTKDSVRDGFCYQHHPDVVTEKQRRLEEDWKKKQKESLFYVLKKVGEDLRLLEKKSLSISEVGILAWCVDQAECWRGALTSNPDTRTLEEFDKQIEDARNILKKLKKRK